MKKNNLQSNKRTSLQEKAVGLDSNTKKWDLNDKQVQSVMEFNTNPHLVLYRGIVFDKDHEFIRSFYKYNKSPSLIKDIVSFSTNFETALDWITSITFDEPRRRKNRNLGKYFFIISTILPVGFPMFDTVKMDIGNDLQEIGLPFKYNNKYLMFHLLSKKHLSLAGPGLINQEKKQIILNSIPNIFILNCFLSYESAPFEESPVSQYWKSWDNRFTEFWAKTKANINDISKEKENGIIKNEYTYGGENKNLDFNKESNPTEPYCHFENGYEPEFIYLRASSQENVQNCKHLSKLYGWYDLHKNFQ